MIVGICVNISRRKVAHREFLEVVGGEDAVGCSQAVLYGYHSRCAHTLGSLDVSLSEDGVLQRDVRRLTVGVNQVTSRLNYVVERAVGDCDTVLERRSRRCSC